MDVWAGQVPLAGDQCARGMRVHGSPLQSPGDSLHLYTLLLVTAAALYISCCLFPTLPAWTGPLPALPRPKQFRAASQQFRTSAGSQRRAARLARLRLPLPLLPPPPLHAAAPPPSMGLQHSKAERRLAKLQATRDQADLLMDTWQQRMLADIAAGVPAGTPGTARAVRDAALEHYKRVASKQHAIRDNLSGCPAAGPASAPPASHVLLGTSKLPSAALCW